MPLFTIPIQQQEQAAASSTFAYPQPSNQAKDWSFIDEISRENLAQSGAIVLYTTNLTGGGSAAMVSNSRIRLTTGATIGDDVDIRLADNSIFRTTTWPEFDLRTIYEVDIIFRTTGTITDMEAFMGLIIGTTDAITAMPGTTVHLGIQIDRSASANWFLTSADGGTQTTTDTGVTIASATNYRVNLVQSGTNDAVLRFYDGTNLDTLQSTQTVTAIGTGHMKSHFFLQTEAGVIKSIDLSEWKVIWS